jgi:UDP:flavonoid glycosyltransferase YjiC (YdhE family)
MVDPDPAGTTRLLLEAIERAGCRAILSRGWAGLGDGPLPDSVFGAGALPHASLFPRLAAVVHHGGAGTTTTAARSGIPQVVIPHLLDQHYWGHRVHLLGVAPPPLPRHGLSAAGLAERIAATLENEFLSERARELAAKLRAGDPLDRAAEAILATVRRSAPTQTRRGLAS